MRRTSGWESPQVLVQIRALTSCALDNSLLHPLFLETLTLLSTLGNILEAKIDENPALVELTNVWSVGNTDQKKINTTK